MRIVQFTVPVPDQGSVCVQEDILPEFYGNYHRHKEIQLTYILKGKGTFLIGNFSHHFEEDEVFIVDADEAHMFKKVDMVSAPPLEQGIHAIHIFIDYQAFANFFTLPEFEGAKSFLEKINGSKKLTAEYAIPLKSNFLKINQSEGTQRLLQFLNLIDHLSKKIELWTSLYTGIPQKKYSDDEGIRMNDIFQYTFAHFTEKVTLEQISEVAHMTPHAFCKYFKKHTRKTYVAFLNEIRVEQACKLLINGQSENMADIAFRTGFNNVVNFNRVFKKVIKLSPSEYVEAYKLKEIS